MIFIIYEEFIYNGPQSLLLICITFSVTMVIHPFYILSNWNILSFPVRWWQNTKSFIWSTTTFRLQNWCIQTVKLIHYILIIQFPIEGRPGKHEWKTIAITGIIHILLITLQLSLCFSWNNIFASTFLFLLLLTYVIIYFVNLTFKFFGLVLITLFNQMFNLLPSIWLVLLIIIHCLSIV